MSPKGKTVKVTEYWRGKGKALIKRPKQKHSKKSEKLFRVRIEYPDRSSEVLTVKAKDFASALDKGIIQRQKFKSPFLISLIRRR